MEKSFVIGSTAAQTRFKVLGAISFSHSLNHMMQSLIVAIYPLLKGEFDLSFVQIGMITLTYVASISSYYSFYLIEKFHVSVQSAQIHLCVFLFAMALGTLVGGPAGERFGRKRVIWFSILGGRTAAAPASRALSTP